jgi:hypothetical protein
MSLRVSLSRDWKPFTLLEKECTLLHFVVKDLEVLTLQKQAKWPLKVIDIRGYTTSHAKYFHVAMETSERPFLVRMDACDLAKSKPDISVQVTEGVKEGETKKKKKYKSVKDVLLNEQETQFVELLKDAFARWVRYHLCGNIDYYDLPEHKDIANVKRQIAAGRQKQAKLTVSRIIATCKKFITEKDGSSRLSLMKELQNVLAHYSTFDDQVGPLLVCATLESYGSPDLLEQTYGQKVLPESPSHLVLRTLGPHICFLDIACAIQASFLIEDKKKATTEILYGFATKHAETLGQMLLDPKLTAKQQDFILAFKKQHPGFMEVFSLVTRWPDYEKRRLECLCPVAKSKPKKQKERKQSRRVV